MIEGKDVYYGIRDINWKRPGMAIRIIGDYIILTIGSIIFLMPLFWMLGTAFKGEGEVYIFPPTLLPKQLLWSNFPNAWTYQDTQFPLWLMNTLTITVFVLIGVLLSSSLCAYGFARIKFPGRDFIFICVLATIMLPGAVTLIPLYVIFNKIGWLNTLTPLIVPAYFGGGASNIFLTRQFFMSIPIELEEAAILDGANRFRIWWQIFIPLSKPILAVVAVFTFQGVWNDFYGPLIYLTTPDKYTLALGINFFKNYYSTQIPYMMAMSFLMVIPMIIIFFMAQKQMIRGVILSGIKA
jgi:multiple sugar transport system permease protein